MGIRSNGLSRRAVYKYSCKQCLKDRFSFVYERAIHRVCMACSGMYPNEDQPVLFQPTAGQVVSDVFEQTERLREEYTQEKKQETYVHTTSDEDHNTKKDAFLQEHGEFITIEREVIEEQTMIFTHQDSPGLFVTGEYFRWKRVDFFANAEYFQEDLPRTYALGLEVKLTLDFS